MSEPGSERSECPECGTPGELIGENHWGCPACENTWIDEEVDLNE